MKKTFSMIGIIAGAIIIIILGIVVLALDTGTTYVESASFGADFYTYSYKAIKIAAQNVGNLANIASKGIGFLLIAIGITDICVFGCKLADIKEPPSALPATPITVKEETPEEVAAELPEI